MPQGHFAHWCRTLVERIENKAVQIPAIVLPVCGIILLRNLVEGFATGQDNHWWQALTYSPFYVALFVWMAWILSLFTGSEPKKVIKVLASFWIIILIPPVLDLILSGTGGVRMRYLAITGWGSFLRNLATVGGFDHGISTGQRVEIITACVLCFFYARARGKNGFTGLACGVSVYLLIFLFGNMIQLFNRVFMAMGLSFTDDRATLGMMYYLVALPALLALTWRQNRHTTLHLLGDSRPVRILHFVIMLAFGTVLYACSHKLQITNNLLLQYVTVIVALFFAGQYSAVVNNFQDLESDRLNSPGRPLPLGIIAPKTYRSYGLACLVMALYGALMAGHQAFIAIFIALGLYQAYSTPPLHLKRLPVVSKGVISTVSLAMALLGYCMPGGALTAFPEKFAIWIWVSLMLGSQYIDLKDVKGDERVGIRTIPVLMGFRVGQYISAACICLSVVWAWLLLPASTRSIFFFFLLCTVLAILCWLCLRKKFREWPVFLVYQLSLVFYMILLCTG